MALTLTFSVDPPCAGGEHLTVTASFGGFSRVLTMARQGALNAPTSDEVDVMLVTLIRLLMRQLSNQSGSQMRTALTTKAIDLTVVG